MFGTTHTFAVLTLDASAAVAHGHGSSFHWGDAGLGAAATLGLVLVGIGALLVLRELQGARRDRAPTKRATTGSPPQTGDQQ